MPYFAMLYPSHLNPPFIGCVRQLEPRGYVSCEKKCVVLQVINWAINESRVQAILMVTLSLILNVVHAWIHSLSMTLCGNVLLSNQWINDKLFCPHFQMMHNSFVWTIKTCLWEIWMFHKDIFCFENVPLSYSYMSYELPSTCTEQSDWMVYNKNARSKSGEYIMR